MKKKDTISSWDFWSPVRVCLSFSTWSCCFRRGHRWTVAMGGYFFKQSRNKRVQNLLACYHVVFSQIIQTWLVGVCPLERVILGGINGLSKAELNQSISCKTCMYTYVSWRKAEKHCLYSCTCF